MILKPELEVTAKERAAFTLVELLVVIALTATLLAMLFPALSVAREKTRQSACLSNLRQIGAAMALYAPDYDGLYPYGATPLDKETYHWGVNPKTDPVLKNMPLLTDILVPYTKTREVWRCPSDTGFTSLKDWPDPTTGEAIQLTANSSSFESFGSSYTYNTGFAFKQKLFATGGYADGQEVGPGSVAVASDLTGTWHGPTREPGDWVYMTLLGDGHVARLNLHKYIEASAVQFEP